MGGVKNNSDGVISWMKGQKKKMDSKQTSLQVEPVGDSMKLSIGLNSILPKASRQQRKPPVLHFAAQLMRKRHPAVAAVAA